jgi:hypothetical protein
MRVRYTGDTEPTSLVHGKEYEVIGVECGFYRVIDEEGIDPDEELQGYLYDPSSFEVVSGNTHEFQEGTK